ncbi:MAG: T9SS type A sorting domain-containing protein [Rhodothermales bacterium]|nr:T9SS type A sorting domain-containing protein [Rhodothermales bacterium]
MRRTTRLLALFALLSVTTSALYAQPVHHLAPGAPTSLTSPTDPVSIAVMSLKYPGDYIVFDDALFFTGLDQTSSGRELWRTDGTREGTQLFLDIRPGPETSNPSYLVEASGVLFFVADDGVHGRELWASDGTPDGTRLVTDAWAGPNGSAPNDVVVSGDQVFFTPWNDIVGRELWVSDGTPAGTKLVKDIVPGYQGGRPVHLTDADGTLYFSAWTPEAGFELWKSDGTPEGTVLIKDIAPGSADTMPTLFTTLGDRVYFAADDRVNGQELWVTDGTSEGTVMMADIRPGEGSSWPASLTRIGDRLVFAADDGVHGAELWESRGTLETTRLVADIWPGLPGAGPHHFVELNGRLFFAASDPQHGIEPWVSDGSAAGTLLVKDGYPGLDDSAPAHLLVKGLRVFYAGDDDSHGYELWVSDGTEAGTHLVKDLLPGLEGSRPQGLTTFGDAFYFSAIADLSGSQRLWRSDGTPEGTRLVIPPYDSLRLFLSHTRLFETWRIRPHLFTEEGDRTTEIAPASAEWTSTAPDVAGYDPTLDRVVAYTAGTARLTASFQGTIASVDIVVEAPILPPVYETIDPYLASAPDDAIHTVPVLVIRYLPTPNGVDLDITKVPDFWWLHEVTLADMKKTIDLFDKRTKFMLEEGSRFRGYKTLRGDPGAGPMPPPSIGYKVVRYLTVYEQTPPSTYTYDVSGVPSYYVDVTQVMDRFSLQELIEAEGVKEVWFWSSPFDTSFPTYTSNPSLFDPADFRGMPESNMASPSSGDISNSWRIHDDLPILDHTYIVYGSNFRRSQAESVHNHGHQLEVMLRYAASRQDGHDGLFWHDFVGVTNGQFTTGRSGWTHMPPNTIDNYDYVDPALVLSDIEDWRPDNTGAKTLVNLNTWGDLPYEWPEPDVIPQQVESHWYIYWMQNMPGYQNTIPYGNDFMTNWWFATAEWDAALGTSPTFGLHGAEPALPVSLVHFDGRYDTDRVQLTWDTASETNNAGFALERAVEADGPFAPIAFVSGQGTTSDPHTYTYTDTALPAGSATVAYRLKQVDMDGQFAYSSTVTVATPPAQFTLSPNYPNPFNPRTRITYTLPVATDVRLAVYDLLGRERVVLVDTFQDAGRYAVEMDAGAWASGQYLYRIQAGSFDKTGVMLLLR